MTAREAAFFELFEAASELALRGAVTLQSLVLNYEDVEQRIAELESREHEADKVVHAMMDKLNKSFITPIDREDLFTISKDLDSITDSINTTGHLFYMYNVREIRPEAKAIVDLIVRGVENVHELTKELKHFKTSKIIREKVREINRLETESDRLYRDAVRRLFVQETEPVEIIRWRATFEALESVLDTCEHVANVILGVVVKHA